MGHAIQCMNFESGDVSSIDLDKIEGVLEKFDMTLTPRYENEIILDGNTDGISDEIYIYFNGDNAVELSIERPEYGERLFPFLYELMAATGVFVLPDYGGTVLGLSDAVDDNNLPDELVPELQTINNAADIQKIFQ